jgi:hypothetical protein
MGREGRVERLQINTWKLNILFLLCIYFFYIFFKKVRYGTCSQMLVKKTKKHCSVAERSFAVGALADCMEPLQVIYS